MTDDFQRLVSSANPAARYRPADGLHNGYPQSFSMAPYSDQPQPAMDPFFDDDDDNAPDSAFGRRKAMESQDSGLPLARSAVPPAGVGSSKLSLGDGISQSWNFDDDHFQPAATPSPRPVKPIAKKREWRWKWPWQKEKALAGERIITLNNSAANGEFASNSISTSKYNLATFIPKFLFGTSTSRSQMFRALNKRHQSDAELNARKAKVLTSQSAFTEKKWKDIKVGDVVRLESDDFIPADMILISSSEPEGLCYIETSNLDGETNLKIKQASSHTSSLVAPSLVNTLRGSLRSENPNNSLYTYEGTLDLITPEGMPKQVPLGPDQMLLRGAQIRNTPWIYGLTVFTGHETKLMRNATAAPIKRTAVERQVNVQIVFLFILLLALSVGSTIGSSIRTWFFSSQQWYLAESTTLTSRAKGFIEDILTFIILYNNLIPISLIVTMEVVKFQQALLINFDLDMYYARTDTPALCRTSSLVEELGQIEYVFSDKTGTLTCNEMEFRCCSIAGVAYADVVDESKRDTEAGDGWKTFAEMRAIFERTSNPFTRKPKSVFVKIRGQDEEFEILNVCEFNSTRKRMSTVIRAPNGKIKIYTKGADTVILERLSKNQPYTDKTLAHLENYATEGLRTLCLAYRDISEQEYQQWSAIYNQAAATINGRGEALDQAAELIEKELFLLGATAIEDKLQDGVPDTIHTLQMAGIKVWVLTGDRQETAINIGMSCRLISESMNLIIVNEGTARETEEFLTKRLNAIKNQRNSGELEDLALIIDGKSLGFALEKEISQIFLELAIMCKAVICCRVSPLQKALVVKLVKKNQKAILLAVGDGANDVSMIQAAHVGVGISGVELLFGFSVILFWGDLKQADGLDSGHWFWGTTLYLAVLLTVLGKAALISDLWTKYTVAAIPGSFIFTMLFLPFYAVVAPAIGFSTEYAGIVPRLWTNAVFYFVLLMIPIFCLARDFAWKYYRRTYQPLSYHIAQELQKYNIPDYRPRQEQFQKAIKKVRATQRMRRNRGFAFSQTENGKQDQARLIRAYDTSKSHSRPTGY
ncbi:hypothetical protein C0992_000210 [Termitomyces sp. T32_za158]|nr:hypothetical protein C0992_000210 [Termitomyces sp. T32_za158]